MIGVVLDTNVLVSANLNDEGLEAFAVSLALSGQVRLYISEPILAEYRRVLSYPRLKFLPADIERFFARLLTLATMVKPMRIVTKCPHEPDNRFLEGAEEAHADFLITGNKRHFPERWKTTRVVNARELLDLIAPQKG